ncbi:MAG: glycoside hydrolase family 15 protein [Acidobacteriota bacterium]|nr:glycoside hydrolase family 15 protein [Acidobacteriota bacterium]
MSVCVYLWLIFLSISATAQNGKNAKWESAGKQGIGTAFNLQSKIWFTLQDGSLTEVFYPMADNANVQYLQFVVVNSKTKTVETERDDAAHQIKIADVNSLSFEQINRANDWEIRKIYTTAVERNSLLVDVQFLTKNKNLELYVFYNPSLKNSGIKDTAWTETDTLLSNEADVFSALKISGGFTESTNGFFGVSDGLEQLKRFGRIRNFPTRIENGNVTQLAKIKSPKNFTVVLSFGKTAMEATNAANLSLEKGFAKAQKEYQNEWRKYVQKLPKVEAKYQAQFNYAAMVLKASEDKTFRGGNVASLSKPWITGTAANEANVGGYHLVWSRDLYQVATAYIALGDKDSAVRALDYLFNVQQRKDGSYPQISWLDGRTLGNSIQMDEVSYPLILAYQLGQNSKEIYLKNVKPTADYIVKTGPKTQQERWEEKGGYSPATIAAEIAGLVCAADIAQKNGDENSAKIYLATADDWAENVERWTATTTGKYGDGNYYLRLTKNGTPDAGERIELNNNAGTFQENEIVDAGFLELVRLGIKSPDDPLIVKSLKVVDEVLKVNTPNGEGFYRYNHDGYGEMADGRPWNWDLKYTGKGHLWALLSGERGQYELARSDYARNYEKFNSRTTRGEYIYSWKLKAETRLDAMQKFANDGLMIPEQIWDEPTTNKNLKFGEGAGSATPLAWSMAQFVRLAVNLQTGKNLDTPEVVARRYGN